MEPQPTYHYYAIVPHMQRPQLILQMHDDGRWYLPHWEEHERRFWQSVDHVNAALWEHFSIRATTLRCLSTTYDEQQQATSRMYEMENRSPAAPLPVRSRWVARDALAGLEMGVPEQREIIATWLDEAETPVHRSRRPWARRGWLDSTTVWIRDQLRQRGITLNEVHQLRTWERSVVLQVRTNAGPLYFKAVPGMFAHEPRLTAALEEWLPGHFPQLIAADDQNHWMLMEDFGGESLEQVRSIADWERALRRFAEIQIGLVLRTDDLLALGCPNRPLDQMATDIDALLDDEHALLIGQDGGLTVEEAEQLRIRRNELHTLCQELADYAIPLSLEHGDFWAGNVIKTANDFLYFDWSDSSIAHPFFSLDLFIQDAKDTFADSPEVITQLLDAYLAAWALYRPIEDLRAAYTIARTLGPLHHAISYHRFILPAMTARWEMERMIPFFLKMVL